MKNGKKVLSLIEKAIVFVCAATGVILSASSSIDTFMGGATVFLYFTIQSNIVSALVALIGGILLLTKGGAPKRWFAIQYVTTLAITVTGSVFCFALAPTMGSAAWTFANICTHIVVPIVSVTDFFTAAGEHTLRKRCVLFVPIPEVAYILFAAVGFVRGWEFAPGANYPYFFLNWGSPAGAFGFCEGLPFMGCAYWILGFFLVLIPLGLLYLAGANAIAKNRSPVKND